MKPWLELDRASAPGGGVLTLCQRDREYTIRVDGRELMGSRAHDSEEQLAVAGCAGLAGVPRARVLVGGLGLGYTLRTALDGLAPDARVDVAEFVPAVVRWNRGPLAHLAGSPLQDPRSHVLEDDVTTIMVASKGLYHAILMDVDNGPSSLTVAANARLYDGPGLARAARALCPGGTFAVWSAGLDAGFTARLKRAGFQTRIEQAPAHGSGGRRHVLWLARRSPKGRAR
jgi:spermidine synthase